MIANIPDVSLMSLALPYGGHRVVELVHGAHQHAPGEKTYIMLAFGCF
jgi:hypothetical protein